MRPPALFLLLLAALALLAAPAAAADLLGNPAIVLLPNTTETAFDGYTKGPIVVNAYDPGRHAVAQIDISAPPGSIARLDLYDQGQIIPVVINRTATGDRSEIVTYSIGDQIAGPYERSVLWPLSLPDKERFSIQYSVRADRSCYLWFQPWMRGTKWANLACDVDNVVYRAAFSAERDTRLVIQTAPYDDLVAAINARASQIDVSGCSNIVSLLKGLYDGVYLVISLGWYLFRTIFIDNFLLFLGLYEAVGLAYAANRSRDIFQFGRKFADYNAKAVNAMFWLIERMVTILTRIVDALKLT